MESSFRFVIFGDVYRGSRDGSTNILRSLLTGIKSLSPQPELIFGLGDMIDGRLGISKGLEDFKSIIEEFYPVNMFYPVIGNHENDEDAFSSVFMHLPYNQLSGYSRTVYYFDHEDARFIALNSIRCCKGSGYCINAYQRQWLDSVLGTGRKKYNFVMMHVPAFPTGSHYGESLDSSLKERNDFWKIIDDYDVTAVFCGHEHNYCRRLINKDFHDKGIAVKNSIYHIISGGANDSLSSRMKSRENIITGPLAVQHYLVIDVNDKDVIMQVYDLKNELIDSCCLKLCISSSINSSNDILIPIGGLWKYLDDGTDQGTLWREADYDDSLWKAGHAELGYGDGGEATVVSYGPDSHRKYITTYFRKEFLIKDASLYKYLTIKLQRDDGAVVYINGTEVYRNNMPQGNIIFKTLASRAIRGPDEIAYEKKIIESGVLKTGINIIAVEIHQVSPSSSDISFNLQLIAHKSQLV